MTSRPVEEVTRCHDGQEDTQSFARYPSTSRSKSSGLGESVNAYTAVPGQKAVQTFTAEHNGQLTTAKLKIHLDSGWGSIDSVGADNYRRPCHRPTHFQRVSFEHHTLI